MPYRALIERGHSKVSTGHIMVYFICLFSSFPPPSFLLPFLPFFLPPFLPSFLCLLIHSSYAQPLKIYDATDHRRGFCLSLHFALSLISHWVCLSSIYPLGADSEVYTNFIICLSKMALEDKNHKAHSQKWTLKWLLCAIWLLWSDLTFLCLPRWLTAGHKPNGGGQENQLLSQPVF